MLHNILVLFFLYTGQFFDRVVSDKTYVKRDIPKCCAKNEVVVVDLRDYSNTCVEYGEVTFSHSNVSVYDENIHDKPATESFNDIFQVVLDKGPDNDTFKSLYFKVEFVSKSYLSKDGFLYLESPNAYDRWDKVNSTAYCIDYELKNGSDSINFTEDFKFFYGSFNGSPKPTSDIFKAALYVSIVFLFLVLVVYTLLPGLRNLGGKVLMAYISSLLFAFLFLGIIQGQQHEPEVCIGLTTTVYFFFLASFCWMNVMSYDIWWTFRGYAKARQIHRRGETFKFIMYCLYGFGLPLAMSIAFVVINSLNLTHMPWFIKPMIPDMGCFLEGGQKLVYLYAPMLILIICNWLFFLMTAFNIWRLNRDTAVLDSPAAGTAQAHRNQRNRLSIYLKLSIIMGLNWLLEVVSSFSPDFQFWYITDIYNLLIGLAIFLIFVCKKKIYRDLNSRFQKNRIPQPSLTKSQTSCTTLSTSSHDTSLQVLRNPNGTYVRR